MYIKNNLGNKYSATLLQVGVDQCKNNNFVLRKVFKARLKISINYLAFVSIRKSKRAKSKSNTCAKGGVAFVNLIHTQENKVNKLTQWGKTYNALTLRK